MPYWRHLKDTEPETGASYPTIQEAREGIDPKTHTVTFIATDDERNEWTQREYTRFEDGTYIPTPWARYFGHKYFDDGGQRLDYAGSITYKRPAVRFHFAHLSISHPGLIAYTKNDEHGIQDRQTRIKPGRYLEEFYRDTFTPEQIAEFVAQCKAENLELKIVTSPDDIVKVYRGDGPRSCMSPGPVVRDRNGDRIHPCAVYGDSDLAMAYLGDIDGTISARSIVWPEKKIYVRTYGDTATLAQVLRQAGYEQGSADGARIRRIDLGDGRLLMPYIDGTSAARIIDRHWIQLGDGDLEVQSETCGYIYPDGKPDDDDDCDEPDDDETYVCEHCNREYAYETQSHGNLNLTYCDRCIDSRNYCDGCDDYTWDDVTEMTMGGYLCDSCIERESKTCEGETIITRSAGDYGAGAVLKCEETWCDRIEFSPDELAQRERNHVTHLCRECAIDANTGADLRQCTNCNMLHDNDLPRCPHCDKAVRCEHTPNMFTMPYYSEYETASSDALASPIDGSLWWKAVPVFGIITAPGFWVVMPNGARAYTTGPDFTIRPGSSVFNTLDGSAAYMRVPDPRLSRNTGAVLTATR